MAKNQFVCDVGIECDTIVYGMFVCVLYMLYYCIESCLFVAKNAVYIPQFLFVDENACYKYF